jgi:hypothetical protein
MPQSGERVYFTVWPGVVVHYADVWALPLVLLTTAIVAGLIVVGLRRRELTGRGLLASTFAALFGVLGAVALAELLWAGIRAANADYRVWMVGHYQTTLHVVMLIFATVALLAAYFTLLGRRARRLNLMAGVLIASLPALWLTSIAAPGASYLVTWPLLFGTLPLGWALLARGRAATPWARAGVLTVAALPAAILLPGTLYQMVALVVRFEGMLGLPVLGLAMLFVAPLAALLLPHLHFLGGDSPSRRLRWAVPATAALAALALLGWAWTTSGFDAVHPRPDNVAYELNADTGEARWVSYDHTLDHWTGQFFPDDARQTEDDRLGYGTTPAYVAPAPAVALAAPEAALLSDTVVGDKRTLTLRLSSPRDTSEMTTFVSAAGEVVAASVNGQPVDLSDYAPARDGEFSIIYANADAAGWELTLTLGSTAPVRVEVEETTRGLPAVPGVTVTARPADTMPSPIFPRDATVVTKSFTY